VLAVVYRPCRLFYTTTANHECLWDLSHVTLNDDVLSNCRECDSNTSGRRTRIAEAMQGVQRKPFRTIFTSELTIILGGAMDPRSVYHMSKSFELQKCSRSALVCRGLMCALHVTRSQWFGSALL
jgi:hypothetical protein